MTFARRKPAHPEKLQIFGKDHAQIKEIRATCQLELISLQACDSDRTDARRYGIIVTRRSKIASHFVARTTPKVQFVFISPRRRPTAMICGGDRVRGRVAPR